MSMQVSIDAHAPANRRRRAEALRTWLRAPAVLLRRACQRRATRPQALDRRFGHGNTLAAAAATSLGGAVNTVQRVPDWDTATGTRQGRPLLLEATRGITIAFVPPRERKRRQPGLAANDPAFVGGP